MLQLYTAVGWWPERTTEGVAAVLHRAPAVGAWQGGLLIGFARAVTDGRFRAYIEDVVVHPAHQRRGVGTALLDRLLQELRHIDLITLFAADEVAGMYERVGFKRTRQVVMHWRPQQTDD